MRFQTNNDVLADATACPIKTRPIKKRNFFRRPMSMVLTACIGIGVGVGSGGSARAELKALKLSSHDKFPDSRWIFEDKQTPRGSKMIRALGAMKKARIEGNDKACVEAAPKVWLQAKQIRPWIAILGLECAVSLSSVDAAKNATSLAQAIARAETDKDWMLYGPYFKELRARWVEARLALIEGDVRRNRSRAASGIDKLESMQAWLDDKQKARLWRSAGELSFIQQRLDEAREYINRSLALMDSSDLRTKLAAIEQAVTGKKSNYESPKATLKAGENHDLESSAGELELVKRITTALKMGDLVPAVEDSIRLIEQYPGGTRAKWATERVQEVFLSIGDKSDEKYILLRDKIIKEMEKADPDRLAEWARVGYNRGFYANALALARRALDGMKGAARATKTLLLAAEAAIHVESLDAAKELYQQLVDKHAGTAAAREALLRIGLIEYRQKNYSKAMAAFERLLVLPQSENFELTARYWLWRGLQKNGDGTRAKLQAEILMGKFPFSYYGLRARAESNNGFIEWPREPGPKIQQKLWLTKAEKRAYDRARILIEAGWFGEAEAELQALPTPEKPEEKALRARLLAAAFSYPQAVRILNSAWDINQDLRRQPFLGVAFPREFMRTIEAQARIRQLDPALVLGLIKQESSFSFRAISSSNALGLMQIIPPTAREIAADLKLGNIEIPNDMFVPSRNITMGTYYLSKMVKKFSGHIPLSLAAYNAGPGKMDRWLRSRPSLTGLAQSRSSNPDDELWIDELPWDETSYYVKAILRNIVLYRVLEKGRIELKNPVWLDALATTTVKAQGAND